MNVPSSNSSGSNMPKDCLLDRIHAMLHQEETSYQYQLYLPREAEAHGIDLMDPSHQLNITWREKICQWVSSVQSILLLLCLLWGLNCAGELEKARCIELGCLVDQTKNCLVSERH